MTELVASACVMVVDDEPGIRESLAEVVEMIGCTAITAADGREALDLLATHRPCLIILDLMMPRLSGLELIDEMRKQPGLADVPILISTSAPHLAPPGFAVLPKPINIQSAWSWIRRSCQCGAATNQDPAQA